MINLSKFVFCDKAEARYFRSYNLSNRIMYTDLNETKLKQIKKKFVDFASESTSHGLPKIFTTNKFYLKIMWFILFVLFATLGVYKVVEMSIKYLEYEVVTRIDVIHEIPTEFPAVTFFYLKDPLANKSVKDILVLCVFKQAVCNENDIEVVREPNGYISYKFKSQKAFIAGRQYGLFLIVLDVDSRNKRTFQDGLRVIVHNDSINPGYLNGISNEGIDISPGFFNSISVNRVFSSKLGEPYSKCLKNISSTESYHSKLFKYIIEKSKHSYTQKDCLDLCVDIQIRKYLNLTDENENWVEKYDSLENITQIGVLDIFLRLVKGDLKQVCLDECPLECDTIKYEISSSFTQLSRGNLLNLAYMANNEKFKGLVLSKLIGFNVFYNDLSYTYISQMPKMELPEFISNIGGILGLFIGISFLSLAEFLELFIEISMIFFHKRTVKANS